MFRNITSILLCLSVEKSKFGANGELRLMRKLKKVSFKTDYYAHNVFCSFLKIHLALAAA